MKQLELENGYIFDPPVHNEHNEAALDAEYEDWHHKVNLK